ncbi:type III secretion HpaP family protein [Algicola sagamiensis]|uniref:type III secretion HpaP family protein n=1 Tax=Algicola sagamiensis TaxID=163869 RepID=UPI00036D88D0|nr:type III secretion HpaP family protein [Algicola sagamiensis]
MKSPSSQSISTAQPATNTDAAQSRAKKPAEQSDVKRFEKELENKKKQPGEESKGDKKEFTPTELLQMQLTGGPHQQTSVEKVTPQAEKAGLTVKLPSDYVQQVVSHIRAGVSELSKQPVLELKFQQDLLPETTLMMRKDSGVLSLQFQTASPHSLQMIQAMQGQLSSSLTSLQQITKVKINIEPVASAKSADADQHSREQHGHSSN